MLAHGNVLKLIVEYELNVLHWWLPTEPEIAVKKPEAVFNTVTPGSLRDVTKWALPTVWEPFYQEKHDWFMELTDTEATKFAPTSRKILV